MQESLFPGLDFTHLVLGMRTGVEDEHKRAPPLPCTGEQKKGDKVGTKTSIAYFK